jgi:preprotein translocase subunit SecG
VDIILLVVHVVLALGIITLVLLQKGAGASAGAVLGGGGGAGSVFGASGSSNFLSKTTAILATEFFIYSMVLAYMASHRDAPSPVIAALEQAQQVEMVPPAPVRQQIAQGMDETVPLPVEEPAAIDVPPPASDTE